MRWFYLSVFHSDYLGDRIDGMEFWNISDHPEVRDGLRELYISAFPANERIPFRRMIKGYPGKESSLVSVRMDGRQVGLFHIVWDDRMLFLFYLAVESDFRCKGLGGEILEHVCSLTGLPVMLNIERTDPDVNDIKARRRGFYIRHGFRDTGYVISDEQGEFHAMCRGKFDPAHYSEFMGLFGNFTITKR